MDALTGQPLWWTVLGTVYGDTINPQRNGSGLTMPGASEGAQGYHAIDNNNTLYFAITSNGYKLYPIIITLIDKLFVNSYEAKIYVTCTIINIESR